MSTKVRYATLVSALLLSSAVQAGAEVKAPSPEQVAPLTGQRTWMPALFAQGMPVIAKEAAAPFELPYSDNFSDGDATRANYTFIDVDNDGIVKGDSEVYNRWYWKADESLIQYCVNQENGVPGNDWLITPGIHLDGKHVYKVTIEVNMGATSNLKLTVGTSTDPATHKVVADLNGIYDSWVGVYNAEFTVSEGDGTYYVGVYNYNNSDSFYLNLWSISVEEGESSTMPSAPSAISVDAAAAGELSATVSVTAPTTLMDGSAITSPVTIEIYRDEWVIDRQECQPGATVTAVDNSMESAGSYTYIANAIYNGETGKSVEATAWVGTDIPASPSMTSFKTVNKNMDVAIEWTPVTEGQHGEYFDPSTVTYAVFRGYNREDMAPIAAGLTTTSYVDTQISEELNGSQLGYFYAVTATNEGGTSQSSAKIIAVGTPYEMPSMESFASGRFNIEPWLTDPISGSFSWSVQTSEGDLIGHDNDRGFTRFYDPYNWYDLTDSRLISPVFVLDGAEKPVVSFWMYHWEESSVGYESTTCIIPEVRVDGGEWQAISEPILAAYPVWGWVEHRFSLSDFKDAETIQFGFRGQTQVNWMYFYIDELRFEDEPVNDLTVTQFYGYTDLNIDDTGLYRLEYYNRGANDVDNFSVELLVDGKVVSTVECEPIAAGQTAGVNLAYQFNATTVGNHEVSAHIVYDGDTNDGDNYSEVLNVKVSSAFFPIVTGLNATLNDDKTVDLTWKAPIIPDVDDVAVDGVEDYEPWLIDGIGPWITYDGDGQGSGYYTDLAPYKWPNCEANQAFIVWAPGDEMLEIYPALAPFSGSQCFVSWMANVSDFWNDPVNNDYLISPEVIGGTSVSFYVKGISTAEYNETYEIMYSTTDRSPESFTVLKSGIASSNWEKVEAQLPDDAKYFAIHYTASFQIGLMVDEIEYTPITGLLNVEGYDVFRNGVKLNDSPLTELTFKDTAIEDTNDYSVAVVYDRGTSDACAPVTVLAANSVNSVEASSDVRLSVAEGMLKVSSSEPVNVTVTAINGVTLFNATVNGERTLRLDKGVYIVRAGSKVSKIAL